MRIDRFIRDISDRLDNIANGNGSSNNHSDGSNYNYDYDYGLHNYDDEYHLDIGQDPPRFKYYRQTRAKKWEALGPHEPSDTDPSITQDEIDFGLKEGFAKTKRAADT